MIYDVEFPTQKALPARESFKENCLRHVHFLCAKKKHLSLHNNYNFAELYRKNRFRCSWTSKFPRSYVFSYFHESWLKFYCSTNRELGFIWKRIEFTFLWVVMVLNCFKNCLLQIFKQTKRFFVISKKCVCKCKICHYVKFWLCV